MIGFLILALVLVFIGVLLVRAALAGKGNAAILTQPEPVAVEGALAVDHLAQMVRIPTLSAYDEAAVDTAQFEAFSTLLKTLYPKVHAACPRLDCGEKSLLFHWKGNSNDAPTVLMAHYDVVPVDADSWQHPPFCGEVFDGELWGRGTLDTKITLMGILETAETLLSEGFVPQNDIYMAFGGDEEVNGHGAKDIITYFKAHNVVPAMVLDEGGAVVEGVFPGVKAPIAVIGIGEKGMMNVELQVKSAGGHASTPVIPSALGMLSAAVVACEKQPFAAHITKPVQDMLRTLAPHMPFALRIVTANLWCFGPLLRALSGKLGGEINAMMRTTMAFTMAKGSKQINVIPAQASVGLNLRLINLDTPADVEAALNKRIANANVAVQVQHAEPASPYAATSGPCWDVLSKAVAATWPGCIVSPYLMIACSDSRHYAGFCDNVYKFSAMALTKAQRGLIHTHDERIPVTEVARTVEFFMRLVQTL